MSRVEAEERVRPKEPGELRGLLESVKVYAAQEWLYL